MSTDASKLNSQQSSNLSDESEYYDPFTFLSDDLSQEHRRGEKVHFTPLKHNHLFLPPVNKFIEFIGVQFSYPRLFKLLEKQSGYRLNLSNSTIANFIGSTGISQKSAKKLNEWLTQAAEPLRKMFSVPESKEVERAQLARSNGADWLSARLGLKGSPAIKGSSKSELLLTMQFVQQRANADTELFEIVRAFVATNPNNKEDPQVQWQLIKPVWEQFSLIPQAELERFGRYMLQRDSLHQLAGSDKLALVKCGFYLVLDFYLHMLASFEVGTVVLSGEPEDKLRKVPWLLCRALSRVADPDGAPVTCFGALLEELRLSVAKLWETDIGEREFAQYIPMANDSSTLSFENERDRRYNVLKAWRKGEDLPSFERLEAFIANATEPLQPVNNAPIALMGRVAMGLDKLTSQLQCGAVRDVNNPEAVAHAMEEVLSRYPVYYQHYLDKHFSAIAKA
ncbi:hypothetical protein [uncultured Ferrimonas sp.]|uniref:hypothetical protein n=1 Tax=uncultured Ferrimonas sp. TaxID=432640 RepID=UPI0026104A90|nr:hypothetical protein [uncultured Ferrimonas sp.]